MRNSSTKVAFYKDFGTSAPSVPIGGEEMPRLNVVTATLATYRLDGMMVGDPYEDTEWVLFSDLVKALVGRCVGEAISFSDVLHRYVFPQEGSREKVPMYFDEFPLAHLGIVEVSSFGDFLGVLDNQVADLRGLRLYIPSDLAHRILEEYQATT